MSLHSKYYSGYLRKALSLPLDQKKKKKIEVKGTRVGKVIL